MESGILFREANKISLTFNQKNGRNDFVLLHINTFDYILYMNPKNRMVKKEVKRTRGLMLMATRNSS